MRWIIMSVKQKFNIFKNNMWYTCHFDWFFFDPNKIYESGPETLLPTQCFSFTKLHDIDTF